MTLAPAMFAQRTTFIVGNEKHAGKTTLLNYLVRMLRPVTSVTYMSIGVDGEGADTLSGVAKPHVIAEAGDFVVTAEKALDRRELSFEIDEVFPFPGVFGRPVLARIVRGGPVELISPGANEQLSAVIERIGAGTILIDGSIDRLTQVSAGESAGWIYVMRVNRVNLTRSIENLRRMMLLQELEASDGARVIEGALTSESARAIDADAITVEDFSRVFLSYGELVELQKRLMLFVCRRIELKAYVVNLYDISRQEFLERLADDSIAERIAFNPYQEAA